MLIVRHWNWPRRWIPLLVSRIVIVGRYLAVRFASLR